MNLADSLYWLQGAFRSTLSWETLTANRTQILPNKSGTIAVVSDTLIVSSGVVAVTAVASIDFAIPAGVKRVTILADQVIITSASLLQLGTSGGMTTTGYASTLVWIGASTGSGASTAGLHIPNTQVSASASVLTLTRISTSNVWSSHGQSLFDVQFIILASGRVTLLGELTTLRLAPQSGNWIAGGTFEVFWEF